MKWSHLLLLLQLEKNQHKEALFTSWARQSVPSSISTAAARRAFTKHLSALRFPWDSTQQWGCKSQVPFASATCVGQALQDLSLSISITGAKAPPREHCSHAETATPARSTSCPACFRGHHGEPGNSDPPGKGLHRKPLQQQQHCRKAAQSSGAATRWHWHSTSEAGGGSWISVGGSYRRRKWAPPPPAVICTPVLAQRKKGQRLQFHLSYDGLQTQERMQWLPRWDLFCFPWPCPECWDGRAEVLCKDQKRKVTGQEHRLTAIWNQIIWVTEGKLPQEMAWIPDLWFCQKVLHKRQSSWITVARLGLSDKATSTAVSPQHLPVTCFFTFKTVRFKTRIPAPQWCSEERMMTTSISANAKISLTQ